MREWSRREERDLRRTLRDGVPDPPQELVRSIEQRLEPARVRRSSGMRASLGAGLTALLVMGVVLVGGASSVSAAAAKAGAAVKNVASPGGDHGQPHSARAHEHHSSSGDQYGPDRMTICHRTPSGHAQTLVLPIAAAQAHLREHRGAHRGQQDTEGPCP